MRLTFPFAAMLLVLVSCRPPVPVLDRASGLFDPASGAPMGIKAALKADAVAGSWNTSVTDTVQSVSFVRVRPGAFKLTVLDAQGPLADSTGALCAAAGAVAGINGSYFSMKALTPVTYVKDDGSVTGTTTEREHFRTNGVILLDGGNISISSLMAGLLAWCPSDEPDDSLPSDEGNLCAAAISGTVEFPSDMEWRASATDERYASWPEVLESGPILIDEGQDIVYREGIEGWKSFYARRHPRSMVGIDASGYVWLVVVDGRARDRAAGMSIAELTALAREMGLTDALNLDGGGSSTLWTLGGGVISHPCDNGRFDAAGQRRVPNALALVRK